jgi:hypothetical protein
MPAPRRRAADVDPIRKTRLLPAARLPYPTGTMYLLACGGIPC